MTNEKKQYFCIFNFNIQSIEKTGEMISECFKKEQTGQSAAGYLLNLLESRTTVSPVR